MNHNAALQAAGEMRLSAQHVEMVVNTYNQYFDEETDDRDELPEQPQPLSRLIAKGGGYFTIICRAVITETVRGREAAEARIAELLATQ